MEKPTPLMNAWLKQYQKNREVQQDWANEMTRHQQAMMKTWQAQWSETVTSGTEAWVDIWMPWASGKPSPKRRR